ncbi:uncharacterized protein LOC144569194 [Carex rostrata]
MPDQSAKRFSMIINLIKSLDSSVQGLQDNSPVRKRHPRSVLKKVSTLLEKAPWQFIPDIVSIVPKLVDPADHTTAASLILSQVAHKLDLEQVMKELLQVAHKVEDDNVRLEEEKKAEVARFEQEKELLKKRAADSEAACNLLKEEKKAEAARFEQEKELLKKRAADSEAACNLLKEEKKAEAARFEQEEELLKKRAADSEAACNLLKEEKDQFAIQQENLLKEIHMKEIKLDLLKTKNNMLKKPKEWSLLDFQASIY